MSEQYAKTQDCVQLRKLLINALTKSSVHINCLWCFASFCFNISSLRISMVRKTGEIHVYRIVFRSHGSNLRKSWNNSHCESLRIMWIFGNVIISRKIEVYLMSKNLCIALLFLSLRYFVTVEIISLQKVANNENFLKCDYHERNWSLCRVRKFA